LKYLFAQENKDHSQTEIIFAITPHIIRAEEITDENRQLIEVGTGNTIGLRYKKEAKPAKTDTPGSPDSPAAQQRLKPSPAAQVTEPTPTSPAKAATVKAPGPPAILPRPSGMSSVPQILRPSAPKRDTADSQQSTSP
jgi:hypothetical protein